MPGLGIGIRLGLGGGGGGAPAARSAKVDSAKTGAVYTIARLLGSASQLSLISGPNSNLTLTASTGVVSAAAAIAAGTSQTAVVREANGQLAIEYPVTITGQTTAAPMPTPSPSIVNILGVLGQSNNAGRGAIVSGIDTEQANIKQFPNISSDAATYRTIRDSALPLYQPENAVATNYLSPANYAAKPFPTTQTVVIVPCAYGETALASGTTPRWAPGSPGGDLYEAAIAQMNAAIAAVLAANPAATINVQFFLVQGEADGDNAVSQAIYAAALMNLIAGMRSRVTGAANAPFIIGGMLPEGVASKPAYAVIEVAHKQVALAGTGVSFVPGPYGYDRGDLLHYNAAGSRALGAPMGSAAFGAHSVSFDAVLVSQNEGNTGTTDYTFTAITRPRSVRPWFRSRSAQAELMLVTSQAASFPAASRSTSPMGRSAPR